jgi:hypothetical protein
MVSGDFSYHLTHGSRLPLSGLPLNAPPADLQSRKSHQASYLAVRHPRRCGRGGLSGAYTEGPASVGKKNSIQIRHA